MTLHGDLVCAIVYIPIVPLHVWKAWTMPEEDTQRNVAFSVTAFFFFAGVISYLAWWKNSSIVSNIALVANVGALAYMNLKQWPFDDECAIVPQLLGMLMVINANLSACFRTKMLQTLIIFCAGYGVLWESPLVELEDSLPLLAMATAAEMGVLFLLNAGIDGLVTVHAARVVLALIFTWHVANEVWVIFTNPNSAIVGSLAIVKAAFFAAVGLTAAGAFRREIDVKESLEVLVEERTKEIRQQAQELQMVELALQSSETAIAITNSRKTIMWWNPALESLCQKGSLQQENSLFQALRLTKADADKLESCFDARHSQNLAEIIVGDSTLNVEVSPFPQSPKVREEQLFADCGDEKTCQFVVVFKDVTADRARIRAEKAAEQKTLLAKAMSESIEVVSHELRTPLQGIMGITSMLLEDASLDKQDDVKESLSLIMASSGLLLTLVNNMLDVRKCEANMMSEFQLAPIPMVPPVKDAIDFCRPLAAISSVGLKLDMKEQAIVESDALRLQQVLINLISNAIKYTVSGSKIVVQCRIQARSAVSNAIESALAAGEQENLDSQNAAHKEKVMVFAVSDEGQGIAAGQEKKIFRKFSQLDSEQKHKLGGNTIGQPSGTGLGLNLCLRFIQLMKGNIWVSNNVSGPGATFSFYLPLVENDSGNMHNLASPTDSPSAPRPSLTRSASASKYRVLFVDDTLINRKVFHRMLKRIGVAAIETVDSGSKALGLLEKEYFNLVISDIQMPEMSGTELSEKIHSNQKITKKPVVVGLTALTTENINERCAASGMADVLHKPLTVVEMYDYFENVVDRLVPAVPLRRSMVLV